MVSSKGIGIDLGTTYSCVGFWQNDHVEIIPNNDGNNTTPSYVSFSDTERRFGDDAKRQAARNPFNTVFNVKRLIGRKFDDLEVQSDIKNCPFRVFSRAGKPYIEVKYRGKKKQLSPEEIFSMLLLKMKKTAEAYLGCTITDAVVSVPSYFNHSQRQAMRDIGTISGLHILRLIDEPNLAAIASGLERRISDERNVLIYDLGGGCCSVSILTIEEGIYEVKSTAGDNHLGGEDFDNRLVRYFMQEFKRKYNKSLEYNHRAIRRLRTACERAKCALSSATEAYIEIDSLFEGVNFYTSLTRARFEDLCADLFRGTLEPIEKVLRDSHMLKSDIHEIVLVGGSTRIPRIVKLISDFFGGKQPLKNVNPDEAVAYGAAVQAAILCGDTSEKIQDLLLLDVVPLSFGIATNGQGHLLSTESEIGDEVMTAVIKRNTHSPCSKSEIFSTSTDNQSTVLIQVYEGERTRAKDNTLLAKFELTGIPPAPRGVSQICVRFNIDAHGILDVSALDLTTGKSSNTAITREEVCLSKEDIDRMVKEAENFEADDENATACSIQRDSLECYAHNLREWINNEKGKLEVAVDETIAWLESSQGTDKEEYRTKHEELASIVNPIMQILHVDGADPIH